MMTKAPNARSYWERHARNYDRSIWMLRRPLPRMLERIGTTTKGARRVLEVAAGTGLVTPTLAASANEVVATDYSSAMVRELEAKVRSMELRNVRCREADIYSLPFAPASFDVVVAANVLHLVPDLPRALACLARVLKPGGALIVPTFCHAETRRARLLSRLMALVGFPGQRRLTTASLAESLSKSGMRVSDAETIPGLLPVGYVEARTPEGCSLARKGCYTYD